MTINTVTARLNLDGRSRGGRLGVLDEPLESSVNAHIVLGRNRVAANLTTLKILQTEGLHELLSRDSLRKIVLVAENKKRDAGECGLLKKFVKLLLREGKLLAISGIDDVHDCIYTTAIALPHAPESRLSSDIPHLDCNVPFGYLLHIETDSWDHIFLESTIGKNVDEGGLATVLKTYKSELHLLLPEETLEPINNTLPPASDC